MIRRDQLTLAARGESRTEPFGADSARMQGRAKRRMLGVFKRVRTQQTGQTPPERRRGDFHHGLLGSGILKHGLNLAGGERPIVHAKFVDLRINEGIDPKL